MSKSLESWALRDRELEIKASRNTLALMEHRWRAVNEGGFSMKAYARAIDRNYTTVYKYAKGWELWQERDVDGDIAFTPQDAMELAKMGAEKAEAHQIVADVKGMSVSQVRQKLPHVAREVQHTVADRVAAGEARDEALDYARRVAERREHDNRSTARRAEQERARFSTPYFKIDGHLTKALLQARDATRLAHESNLNNDEERDLLVDRVNQVRSTLDATMVAIAGGELATDWDAAVSEILNQ